VFQRYREAHFKLTPKAVSYSRRSFGTWDMLSNRLDRLQTRRSWWLCSVGCCQGTNTSFGAFKDCILTSEKFIAGLTPTHLTEEKLTYRYSPDADTNFRCLKALYGTCPRASAMEDFMIDTDASKIGI
jgi:hypothetical protein